MNYSDENMIMTVNGYISGSKLGFCHSHEHLFLADGQSAKVHSALKIDEFNKTITELNLYKSIGGNSIIDAQPIGCGRMAEALMNASSATGVKIIAATGFHKLMFYPPDHWIHSLHESKLAKLFISEFESGLFIDGDLSLPSRRIPAYPGIINVASGADGVDNKYIRLFTAAAETSINTGAPILCHTEMGKGALEQINFFTEYGISTESIIVCHLDRTLDDFTYQLEVAKTGVYLLLDTIGRFKYHSDEAEAEFIVKLVEQGFENKILLGLDTTRERMKSYDGSLGLDYIASSFIPLLKAYGLSDKIISKFMIHNPAKAFIKNRSKTKIV